MYSNNRNEFRFNLVNKQTGRRSYSTEWCYGNIYDMIREYRENMKKMCLVNVSNDTRYIESVQTWDGEYIWRNPENN